MRRKYAATMTSTATNRPASRQSAWHDGRRLTQAQAATLFGVTQPRISDLFRGKIDRFSIDALVAMLGHAGVRSQIVVGRRSKVA
jgi:predicted XRE-type DNA-binding protein